MKKESRTTTINLSPIAHAIKKRLDMIKPYGWTSQFFSEALIKEFGHKFQEKILAETLTEKTNKRNTLDLEIQRLVTRLQKIKAKNNNG